MRGSMKEQKLHTSEIQQDYSFKMNRFEVLPS